MWGFMMCFASTCVATFYDYYLELEAPYGYLSIPVLLGTIGGIGMVIGCIGLWVIKLRSDPNPRASMQSGLDYSFIIMLFLSSASANPFSFKRNVTDADLTSRTLGHSPFAVRHAPL